MKLKAGEIIVIDGIQFIGDADGVPHKITSNKTRKVSKWEDAKSVEIPYKNGSYEVAVVEDRIAGVSIYAIKQWLKDENGVSKIQKNGKDIPKKVISLSGDKKVVRSIAKALLDLTK